MKKILATLGIVLIAVFTLLNNAQAQNFPTKPVRFIVPDGPGNSVDLVTRLVAAKLSEKFGWEAIVENISGGRMAPAARAVLREPPDGHTIFSPGASIAIYSSAKLGLPYDLANDFVGITRLINLQIILATNAERSFNDINDVVAYAKSHPGELTFAAYQAGSGTHLAGELLQLQNNIELRHIPYGDSSFMIDLMAGRVDLGVFSATTLASTIEGKKVRPLGILGLSRSPLIPDVPTISEQGLPEMDSESWVGLLVKKGTPEDVIDRINQAVREVLELPDVQERITGMGAIPAGETKESYRQKIQADLDMYTNILKDADIKLK